MKRLRALLPLLVLIAIGVALFFGGALDRFDPHRIAQEEAELRTAITTHPWLAAFSQVGLMINSSGINYVEGRLWIAILAAQAIPYASALVGAWVAHRSGDAVG